MGVIAWQIAEGFGHAKINAMITAAWLVITVPLMLFAADAYGPIGVALARLAAVCVTIPVILYCEDRFLGRPFLAFWAGSLLRIAAAAALTAAAEIAVTRFLPTGWLMLLSSGSLGLATFGAALYFSGYFTREEQHLFSNLLLTKLGIKKNN
jgi:hypothetical protein